MEGKMANDKNVFGEMKDYFTKQAKNNSSSEWNSKNMLGLRLFGEKLDCDYKIDEVQPTKYYGANIRALVNEFNKEDFSKKDIKEIALLCSEINQRVSKKIGARACTVQIVEGLSDVNFISSFDKSNVICVVKNNDGKGIDYLFNTLKATFMSYLYQNNAKVAGGYDFDRFAIVNNVQQAVLEWSGDSPVDNKCDIKNLDKVESEIFAYENLIDLKDKGLEFSQKTIKYLQKNNNLDFSSDVFDKQERERMQDELKDGYYNIKQIYNKNKDFVPQGIKFCLENAFLNLKEEDFDVYFDKLATKINNFEKYNNQEQNKAK